MKELITEKLCQDDVDYDVGFTFSFPSKQSAVNIGILTKWTKGFCATGCVGYDAVQRLQEQFDKKGIRLKCKAILNDTVGTMMANAIYAPHTKIGVIVGTGTNACYVEEMRNIGKNECR